MQLTSGHREILRHAHNEDQDTKQIQNCNIMLDFIILLISKE